MSDFRETTIECTNENKHATFCSSEKKWINKIDKLHEKHPNEVEIIALPETNDGMIMVHIPKSWIKVSPPAKRNFTDEQKAAMAERMRNARNNK